MPAVDGKRTFSATTRMEPFSDSANPLTGSSIFESSTLFFVSSAVVSVSRQLRI